MTYTTLRGEGFSGLTIDEYGEGGSRDAGMNKVNEVTLKPESSKGCSNEVPFKAVKSLSKVKFKQESLLLPILKSEGVDYFLSDDDVGRYVPVLNKSSMRVINIVRQVRLKSIGKGFSNNLINDIVEANGPKVLR